MVQIGAIDPESLRTISPAVVARLQPLDPPAPAATAAPPSPSIPRGMVPLSIDEELATEGARHRYLSTHVDLPAEQQSLLEAHETPELYARHFANLAGNDPAAQARFGVSSPMHLQPLANDQEKQQLLAQLQRGNAAREAQVNRRAAELGHGLGGGGGRENLGADDVAGTMAALAAEEARAGGQGAAAGSQFAHGISGVTSHFLVDPIRRVTGLESQQEQEARLAYDRALQAGQAGEYPITATVAKMAGQGLAPESVATLAAGGAVGAGARATTALGRVAMGAAQGAAYGGTVMPLQQIAETNEAVTPGQVLKDVAAGAAGGAVGQAGGEVLGRVLGKAPPMAQAVGKFAGGAAVSGGVMAGTNKALAAAEGRDYTAADAVRDFIAGAALHVPGGIPEALHTLRAARDRIASADPRNQVLPKLDAEIAMHALEQPLPEPDAAAAAAPQEPTAPLAGAELRKVGGLNEVDSGQSSPPAPARPIAAVVAPTEASGGARPGPVREAAGRKPAAPESLPAARTGQAEPAGAVPPAATPDTGLPQWAREEIGQRVAAAEKAGVVPAIEELSAGMKTAKEVAQELSGRIPGDDDPVATVRAVRAKLGIPSMDDRTAFTAWRDEYRKRVASAAPAATIRPAAALTFTPDDIRERIQQHGGDSVAANAQIARELRARQDAGDRVILRAEGKDRPVIATPDGMLLDKNGNKWGLLAAAFGTGDDHIRTEPPLASTPPKTHTLTQESTHGPQPTATTSSDGSGRPGVRGVPPRGGGRPRERPAGAGSQQPAAGQGDAGARRQAVVEGIRTGLKPYKNVTLHDDGENLHLVLPSGKRLPTRLHDEIHATPEQTAKYLESTRAALGADSFVADGRTITMPKDAAEFLAMPAEDQAAIRKKFRISGAYNRKTREIHLTRHVAINPSIASEEVFHALAHELEGADRPTYGRMLERFGNEDEAFRGFMKSGKDVSRAEYFRRLREGEAHLPAAQAKKAPPMSGKGAEEARRQAAAERLLLAAQGDGFLLSDHEFEAFKNDAGGLSPDVLADYRATDPKTGKPKLKAGVTMRPGEKPHWSDYQLTREGNALAKFVDEDGFSNATEDMDPAAAGRYQDRIIHELLLTKEQKIHAAAEAYLNVNAPPELQKDAERVLGRPVIHEEDIPFAVRERDQDQGQLTLAGEVQGRETVGGTGQLFGRREPEEPRRAVVRESPLPEDAGKFTVTPDDIRKASAFSDGDPSAAFAYGVKRAMEGKAVTAVKGMRAGEAKEAQAGAKAARAGMSEMQAQHAQEMQKPAAPAVAGQDKLFAVRGDDEEGKPAPNVVKSAAILAAAKTLKALDPHLFDAPAAPSELPLKVSAAAMRDAIEQVRQDWQLDPKAMEKYQQPVEAMARKLLAIARRQGSFDAALEYVKSPPTRDTHSAKEMIKGSTQSADPDKVILSASNAVKQAMRLREAGRTQGLQEAIRLRQKVLDEAVKYLPIEDRGRVTGLLANIRNESGAYKALEQVHQLFAQVQKRRAVDDVMNLLHGRDTKFLRSEFKPALEALVGNLQETNPSEATRRAAESLATHWQTLSPEQRDDLPRSAHELLARLTKEPLSSFTTEDLQDLAKSIRGVVTQSQLKTKLIQGKHLEELQKTSRAVVHQVLEHNDSLGVEGEEGQAKTPRQPGRIQRFTQFTDSPEVMTVSAGGEGGALHDYLYNQLREGTNRQWEIEDQYLKKILDLTRAHGMSQEKLIDWYQKTRRIQLAELPEEGVRRGGGLDAIDEAHEMADVFGAPEDNAARAAGESIERGTGERAVDAARRARSASPAEEAQGTGAGKTAAAGEVAAAQDRSIELTGPELVSAWLLSQNDGAREKLLSNKVLPKRFKGQQGYNRKLTEADLHTIEATLTPFEKAFGQMVLEHGGQLGQMMDPVFQQLYGYGMHLEENYYPVNVDQLQTNKAVDELASIYSQRWLEQGGQLKERVIHNLPILLGNAMETHLESLKKAASFTAKAVAVRNARVLLGDPKVRETLDAHRGGGYVPAMERLLKDYSGSDIKPRDGYEKAAAWLARNLATSTLGLRPSTVATNFVGGALDLMTQMDLPEIKAFVKAFINAKANTLDAGQYLEQRIAPHNAYLARRYSPHAEWHRQAVAAAGESSPAAGSGLPTAKTAGMQKFRNFQEWSMSFMGKAERASAVAYHRALTNLYPEMSPEEVATRVEKAVRRTQNPLSSEDMSTALRSAKDNPLIGLALMFTSQAAKQRDVLRLATLAYQRSGKSRADAGRLAATYGLVAASAALLPAFVRAAWSTIRSGGREEEAARDKTLLDRGLGFAADLADVAHPWIGDAVRLASDPTKSNDGMVNRSLALVQQGVGGIYKEFDGRPDKGTLLERVYRLSADLARAAASVTGVPLEAPLSALEGAGKAIAGRPAEFHMEQELARLRRGGGPGGLALSPADRVRLRALGSVSGRIAQIRKLQAAGRMEQARGDQIIQQLLAVAGRYLDPH